MAIPEETVPEVVSLQVVRRIEAERNGTLDEVSKMQVTSLADSDVVNVILRKLTLKIKVIKELFKPSIDKAKAAYDEIRAFQIKTIAPLETRKVHLNNQVMTWRSEERERRAIQQTEADAKRRDREELEAKHAEEGRKPPGPEPVIEEPIALEKEDVTKTRKVWDYEVVGFEKVPHEFLSIDSGAVRRAISSGVRDIAGIKIYQREIAIFG